MEENSIFLKVHEIDESGMLQEIEIEDTQNRILSQALMSSQDIKLDETPMQWGYVIDTDSKSDTKLQNYESKPATITVIKIGGIEDLSPLNFTTCVPSLNPLHQVVVQDKMLVDHQMKDSTPPNIKQKDKQKRKYPSVIPMSEPAVVCENCDGAFPTKYQYQRHQCEFNAAKVTLKQELPKRHIEKPKTKHECKICHKSFMTDHNLDRHQLSHGDTKPFTCQNCGKGFVLESRLNTHLENHCKMSTSENKRFYRTDLTVWQCWNCQLITASEPIHLVHICDNLNPTFVSTKKILPPQNHPDENKENIDPSCFILPSQGHEKQFENNPGCSSESGKVLGDHNANINDSVNLVFANQNNFDKNFEKAIDGMDVSTRPEPGFYKDTIVPAKLSIAIPDKIEHTFKKINIEHLFQCEFCNRTYAHKDVLKEHQNSHCTSKNYQCMFCEESFESYTNALVHWQHKCDDKSNLFCLPKIIVCKFCDKGFKSHELLYAHKYKLKHFVPKLFNKTETTTVSEKTATVSNSITPSEFKTITTIFDSNSQTINEAKPNMNLLPFRNFQDNHLFADPTRSEISFQVTDGFGMVTITEFTKSNQREVMRELDVSVDSNVSYNCNNAQIIRLDENMEIENFDNQEITQNENKLSMFTEEEIHENISPLHTDTCSNDLTQIDEFLNDIANKVLNKTESTLKSDKCSSQASSNVDPLEKNGEDFSMRRKLRSSTKKNMDKENVKEKKSDKKHDMKKKLVLKESMNRVCTRNMRKLKNKLPIENVTEPECEEVKPKTENKDTVPFSPNEDDDSSEKRKNLKRRLLEKDVILKPAASFDEPKVSEPKPALILPSKRGRKPKPKLPPSEMIVTCSDGFRFQCEKCARITRSIDELIEHRQTDHGSKFDCKDCGQVVHSSKALMIHCRAHQSLKPFVCDQCGRSYSQTSHLWQHMRFHQGIKPFACPHDGCEARYTIRPDLKDHIRKVHTRERPFKCSVCSKCFLTGSVYYQHRLIHNNDRRYGCDMCGKRFFRADALNNHRRIHTDERPFPCPVCGREFRQKGDRNKHHRTQHPTEIALSVARSVSLP